MQLVVRSMIILFDLFHLISAKGKPIDIFNQGGKGDILQLRPTDGNSSSVTSKDQVIAVGYIRRQIDINCFHMFDYYDCYIASATVPINGVTTQKLMPSNENRRMYNALPKYSNLKWRVKGADGTVVIPFIVTGRYDASERAIIAAAMKKIHQNTCIRFVPRTTERDFIDIQNRPGEGCYTNVGRVGGRGILMLESDPQETCIEKEIVLHELMHVIGLWHEHMRYDRDKYIKIMWMNIPRNYWSQFEKVTQDESSTYGIPYDYKSVMHYGKRAFAYPGRISMKTADPKFQNIIGRSKDASPNDWRKICAMYGCQSCMGGKADEKEIEDNESNTSNDEDDDGEMDEVTEVIVRPIPTECVDVFGSFCRSLIRGGMLDCTYFGRRYCCETCSALKEKWTDPFDIFTSFFDRFRF